MLSQRLLFGSILAAGIGGVLIGDAWFLPYAPFLLVCALLTGVCATHELIQLIPTTVQPSRLLVSVLVVGILLANWWAPIRDESDSWPPALLLLGFAAMTAFLVEMARYQDSRLGSTRVAFTLLIVIYLGLLPSFFLQLRWHFPDADMARLALLATIFVPKCGDIGAYFTGRLLGRHRFSPILSPKKTWEGFCGGLLFAIGTAIVVSTVGPLFPHGMIEAVGFGLCVGLAGVFGDLAESMLKRDAGAKDAAKSIPGFGGVLDVIDSVIFAGPVAYLWFSISH